MSPSFNKSKSSPPLLRLKILKMLSSNPLRRLLYVLLFCLALVIVFTITTKNFSNHVIHNPPNTNTLQLTEYKDDENDEVETELLRVASRAKQNPSSTNPKKLAFMFLTTSTLPFEPLWESFFNQVPKTHFNIYVHVDPTISLWTPQYSSVFYDRLIGSKRTSRHSPALAAAARRLLASALVDDFNNYMFILLSDSCIPLHSFGFTYHVLVKSNKSFIEMVPQNLRSFYRWSMRGPHVMLPEIRYEEFRARSQFWSLIRKHALLVVADTKIWSKFKFPCMHLGICYPEEHYFPTLMNMLDSKECVHATLTHVDWTGRIDGHPRVYEKDEVGPHLIWALRRDRPKYDDQDDGTRHDIFLFARKFSPNALQALMAIADRVIFKD